MRTRSVMATQLAELRRILEGRFPNAVPVTYRTADAVATGIGVLDRVLPGGGLPRGRLAAWAPGGGATAMLQAACDAVVRRGERAAWVDGGRVLSGEWLAAGGWRRGGAAPVLIHPGGEWGRRAALACTEELLRSGGFALVVLSGVAVVGTDGVRLSRAAREGGGAFVALSGGVPVAALRLASGFMPERFRWRRGPFGEAVELESVMVRVKVSTMGSSSQVEFSLPVVDHEHRLALDPWLADRRGADRAPAGRRS